MDRDKIIKNIEKYIYLKDLVVDCGGIDKFKFTCYTIYTDKERK